MDGLFEAARRESLISWSLTCRVAGWHCFGVCGIAGFTTFSASHYDPDQIIRRMTQVIRHRGPDGEGYYRDATVTFGHRRLAIIDLGGGAQPMADDSDRYSLVYNGEVYNYIELRRELEQQGHRFRTHSDTEVLLQCLVAHGTAALSKLDGMFAFALWDCQQRQLLLARDRVGIKPLYYFCHGPDLIFASEIKALLQHPLVARTLDPLSVSKYFSYGYVPAPRSVFASIRKVEPGAWLKFDANGLSQGFYWDIPLTDNPVGPGRIEECCEELLQLMRNSVRRQLRSDVPVGVFLSGGIDSSAITALAAQESSGRLHSFSIGFDQAGYDESPHARRVASLFGTEHHEEIMTLQQAADFFPRVIQSLDEPFADASALPTSLLCQFAAKSVKVVLGGDGGDELFAGYPSFQAHKVVEALSFLPVGWRDWLGHLVRRLPVSHHYTSVEYLMQQFLKGLGLPPEVRFLLWMGCYGNAEKQQLFSTDFRQQLAGGDPFEDVARYVRRSGLIGDFERLQYLCLKLYFQDDILVKMDRSSMAHSLEVRVPFMDRDLMEYACRIQPFNKLRGMQTKYVLKRALHGLLPDDIIHRRKAGFMMPVARWLSGEMRETVEDLCSPGAVSRAGLFDAAFVRQILDEHFQRRRDHRKHIYPLVCFMAWLRNQGTA
jgi:asparagine synthase (glutamine-hydrolysing)